MVMINSWWIVRLPPADNPVPKFTPSTPSNFSCLFKSCTWRSFSPANAKHERNVPLQFPLPFLLFLFRFPWSRSPPLLLSLTPFPALCSLNLYRSRSWPADGEGSTGHLARRCENRHRPPASRWANTRIQAPSHARTNTWPCDVRRRGFLQCVGGRPETCAGRCPWSRGGHRASSRFVKPAYVIG